MKLEILTPRELDTLACLLENSVSTKIAPILGVSVNTVDTHVFNIGQKLELYGRAQLVDYLKRSVHAEELHQRFVELLEAYEFKEALKTIKNLTHQQHVVCKIACDDPVLKKRMEDDFKSLHIQCFSRKKGATLVLIRSQDNYYKIFFNALQQLIPDPLITKANEYFTKRTTQFSSVHGTIEKTEQVQQKNNAKIFWMVCVGILFILGIAGGYVYQFINKAAPLSVHSDFFVAKHILERPDVIKKIHTRFSDKEDIKVVALVGIGGAGKTTIARSYACKQTIPIVYELNAETKETLLNDFGLLAYKLASHNLDDKLEFERIKKIEKDNHKEYQEKLIYFIQKKLKQTKWFLIYDNVDILADIREFLPTDSQVWGRGSVLLTTRNGNIASSGFVKDTHVIALDELTKDEKLKLFTAIKPINSQNKSDLENFLQAIPSFPLDVSSVAYYMKDTKSSYKECLEVLNKKRQTFDPKLSYPRKFDHYDQTRYSIIACIVDQILKIHKDFSGLLLMTSTIDSQRMPKALFQKYADIATLNKFIQTMYKFSFFSDYTKTVQDFLFMHRSVQELIWLYLIHYKLTQVEQRTELDAVVSSVYQYTDEIIENYDIDHLRLFLPHTRSFLEHLEAIKYKKNEIVLQLGRIYYYLGYFTKAKPTLMSIMPVLRPEQTNDFFERTVAYLGSIYRVMGESKQAEGFFLKSIHSYQQTGKTNFLGYPFALMEYGWVLRERGQYDCAKNILQKSIASYKSICGDNHPKTAEAIFRLSGLYEIMGDTRQAKVSCEKSLAIHKKHYGADHEITIWDVFRLANIEKLDGQYKKAISLFKRTYDVCVRKYQDNAHARYWAPLYLGDAYRCAGLYKQSFKVLKEATDFSSQYYDLDNTVTQWALFFLGRLYIDQGGYTNAQKLLERSLELHEQKFGKNHIDTMRIKYALAYLYAQFDVSKSEFKEAEKLYQECLVWFEKHYGSDNPIYAQVLRDFGYLYILKKDFRTAENMIKQALKILEDKKHDEVYRCYEYLGDLYRTKGQEKQAQIYYIKSLNYLKKNFPKNSAHIVRLKSKLPFSERVLNTLQN